MKIDKQLEVAKNIINNAHVPYSNFTVCAILETKDGKIYTGVNVENHGIQSICAERCAFVKAISEREKEFISILVIGKNRNDSEYNETLPCGYYRQFMSEFCSKDFKVYTYESKTNTVKRYELKDLLPYSFKL